MTRATDLRYGRRGGGWVPGQPVREHRAPHTYTEHPCPSNACAGRIRRPSPRPQVAWLEVCDGEFTHRWTVTPLGTPTRPFGLIVSTGPEHTGALPAHIDSSAAEVQLHLLDPDDDPADDDGDDVVLPPAAVVKRAGEIAGSTQFFESLGWTPPPVDGT